MPKRSQLGTRKNDLKKSPETKIRLTFGKKTDDKNAQGNKQWIQRASELKEKRKHESGEG